MTYVPVEMNEAKLLMFTDESLENDRNLRSQLGFLILLDDKKGNANIINYGSVRCPRVIQSVIARELHTPSRTDFTTRTY